MIRKEINVCGIVSSNLKTNAVIVLFLIGSLKMYTNRLYIIFSLVTRSKWLSVPWALLKSNVCSLLNIVYDQVLKQMSLVSLSRS